MRFLSKKKNIEWVNVNKSMHKISDLDPKDKDWKLDWKEISTRDIAIQLDFDGDVNASQVNNLRKYIDSIILISKKRKISTVLVRIKSGGGTVTGYGLGSAQLQRLRDNGINLIVCIDEIAASGGYMMACVADRIYATSTAVVGSIGVVASMPNYTKLMEKIGIDYMTYTAGKYKRTVTPYNIPSKEQEEHLINSLSDIHNMFKEHVMRFRKNIDIDVVSTGEVWSGNKAKELNLIDGIAVSDDIILTLVSKYNVYKPSPTKKKTIERYFDVLIDNIVSKIFLKSINPYT